MKYLKKILLILTCVALHAGCSSDIETEDFSTVTGEVTFIIDALPQINVNSRAADDTPLGPSQLRYVLADGKGNILNPHYQKLESDFSRLTIEGLRYDDYTIAFMASVGEDCDLEILKPGLLSDTWINNTEANAPADGQYYYKKVKFTIGKEQEPIVQDVSLDLCVGKVNLDINVSSEYMWRLIKKVSVSFDDTPTIPIKISADGAFSGEGNVKSYDITRNLSFHSFPTDKPVSGYIDIESERINGDKFSYRYRFDNCKIEAGKISHIRIDYRHPDGEDGRLYVREADYTRFDTDTMFLAKEPKEIFYNANHRSFYVNAPLQISVTSDHHLGVKLFSPIPVKNVKVMCRFNKVSHEFVELANFETIYPFMEASFPIPVVNREATFTTSSGRKIKVPAQTKLENDDVTFSIVTDDPFMEKISRINNRWYIRFSPYGADNGHASWRHMTPELCRHGVALALNMSFMFSSEEFSAELDKYDGILFDNGKNPIDLNALRNKIKNHAGLVLGKVVGVGGLGGGTTYGLADYCYRGVYFDATAPESNPHNYARQAMFHEYGHCLGYNHTSNMTYGDKWTVLCAKVFVSMGKESKLPVNSKNDVGLLPM